MLAGITRKESGFTLIEIAVVLVIIGLLLGSFISTFAQRIDATKRDNTKNELKEIKSIIMAYAFTRTPPRLPCPDTDVPPDGLENRSAANCSAAFGSLPWRDVGMGYEDAWGTRYRYWVNNNYATNTGFSLTTSDNAGMATIRTRVGKSESDILTNAVAVIFSHGKNGLGGVSSTDANRDVIPAVGNGHDDENENMDADVNFISRSPTGEGATTSGGVFDDIVEWINSYELKAKMVNARVLP